MQRLLPSLERLVLDVETPEEEAPHKEVLEAIRLVFGKRDLEVVFTKQLAYEQLEEKRPVMWKLDPRPR